MLTVEKRLLDSEVAVLALAGRLTLGRECQRVEWLVDDLLREGKHSVIFDLSGLSFIDSAGVGIVVQHTTACRLMPLAFGLKPPPSTRLRQAFASSKVSHGG
jgi:anti-anti-sigma factor